jgi:pyrrolidone-carboxylate peptidase
MKVKKTKLIIYTCVLFFLILVNIYPVISGTYLKNNQNPTIISNEKGNIMVTGFWNPTGQMIKSFSTNSYLNPEGWEGENWENFGYNIYSYFPTPDIYNGTFEVDYQNTWNDFWNITSDLNPIAIISFGAGSGPWEIEYNTRNLKYWTNDENKPYQPTPAPPDDTVDEGYVRHSTLPIEEIQNAVNDGTNIEAWIDWEGNPGQYLCEYIAYIGMWYQNIHSSSSDQYHCRSAGFIHVNSGVPVDEAMKASNITIRKTIEYLDSLNEPPSSPLINGPSSGKAGDTYNYNIMAIDPEDGEVSYFIDWGDETTGGWTRMLPSGEVYNVSYFWGEEGDYSVKVKAKDEYGTESDWTTLEVTMPNQKTLNQISKIILWLLDQFPFLQPYFSQFH